MKWQFNVTHTIRQTQIPALLNSWVTNTPSVKMLCPQKNCLFLYFRKCWSIDDQSSFFCLMQNCVSVDYEKLIFQLGYFRLHVVEVL